MKNEIAFIGREIELELAGKVSNQRPAILIIYGRRRIGKTSLVEQGFRGQSILKFEGLEGLSKSDQVKTFLKQLVKYLEDKDEKNLDIIKSLIKKLDVSLGWFEALGILATYVRNKKLVIFLEEFQWLASYDDELISSLKYYWDNEFKNQSNLLLILCGSSPSFMIQHVVYSKSLYNRSQYEIPLQPFSLQETRKFLGTRFSINEIMDAYLLVGGVPEYLKYLLSESSVFLSLAKNSFTKGAFFRSEFNKIFISSLSENPHYKAIVNFLAQRRFATREEILKELNLDSGSNLTRLLEDLDLCGIVSKYTPYNKNSKSKLVRYEIADPYLQFYYKFIEPISKFIDRGEYHKNPLEGIKLSTLDQWLGYSFERFCRHNSRNIAKLLGFEAVEYASGPFFNRATSSADKNYQLDLVFDRKDKVVTVVEVKYTRSPVTATHAKEFLSKLDFFKPKGKSTQRVLVCNQEPTEEVRNGMYFDRIITLTDLFSIE